jgi:hypothetical protein
LFLLHGQDKSDRRTGERRGGGGRRHIKKKEKKRKRKRKVGSTTGLWRLVGIMSSLGVSFTSSISASISLTLDFPSLFLPKSENPDLALLFSYTK